MPFVATIRRTHPVQEPSQRARLASWRFHACVALFLLVSLTATALYALYTANQAEFLRRIVILHARAYLQRDVEIGHVTFDPRGRVQVTDMTIAGTPRYPSALLTARTITIHFDPLRLYAFPRLPLRALTRIEVDHPTAFIARDRGGAWNFADLLRPKTTTSRDRFAGEVVVRHGEVAYQDARGWALTHGALNEHLTNLSLRMTRAGAEYMPFRLSATTSSGHLRTLLVTGGVRTSDQRTVCQVRLGEVDLAFVQKFFKKSWPITLEHGTADGRWQLTLEQDPRTHAWRTTMSILADFRDLQAQVRLLQQSIPCHLTRGQFRLAEDIIELVDCRGEAGGIPVTVDGTISHLSDPVIAMQVRTTGADARRVSVLVPGMAQPKLTWGGQLDAWAQLTGHAGALRVVGQVSGPSLTLRLGERLLALQDIRGRLHYGEKTLAISQVSAHGLGGALAGNLWLATGDTPRKDATRLLFRGDVTGVQANEIARLLPMTTGTAKTLGGALSGPITVTMAQSGDVALIAQPTGTLRLEKSIESRVEAAVRVAIPADHAPTVHIERMACHTPVGEVYLQGKIDEAGLTLTAQGSAIDLHALGQFANQADWQGTGYFSGTVTGSLDAPAFSGTLRGQQGRIAGREFAELSTDVLVTLRPDIHLTLANLRVLSGTRQLELSAATLAVSHAGKEMTKGWRVEAIKQANLSRSSIASLLALLGPKKPNLPLDGFAEGTLDYTPSPVGGRGTGMITLTRPALHFGKVTLDFRRATIKFAQCGDDTVVITEARVEGDGVPGHQPVITAHGWLTTAQRITPAQIAWVATAMQLSPDSLDWLSAAHEIAPAQQCALFITSDALPIDEYTTFAGKSPLFSMSPDGRVNVPLELNGGINLSASITGRVTDAAGKISPEALLTSLEVTGKLAADKSFTMARVPFGTVALAANYRCRDNTLTVTQLAFGPADTRRDYLLTLPRQADGSGVRPCRIRFAAQTEFDVQLVLQSATTAEDGTPQLADLAAVKQDMAQMSEQTVKKLAVAQSDDATTGTTDGTLARVLPEVMTSLHALPERISGNTLCTVSLTSSPTHPLPVITATLQVRELQVSGTQMPTLDASLSYEIAQRRLVISRLLARGGEDRDAELKLANAATIILPLKDDAGHIVDPGKMTLEVDAQNIDPALLAHWFPHSGLQDLGGEINIYASTLEETPVLTPQWQASLDWFHPTIHGVQFDAIQSIVSLENDDAGGQRLWIGNRRLARTGYATVQWLNSGQTNAQPLEISGYLPFRWQGGGKSPIPTDEPFALTVNLPAQGLDVIKTYLPQMAPDVEYRGEGTIAGHLAVTGTLAQPEFTDASFLRLHAPDLTLPLYGIAQGDTQHFAWTQDEWKTMTRAPLGKDQRIMTYAGADLPNHLRDVVADLRFRTERQSGRLENVVEINDFSALYGRDDERPDKYSLIEYVRKFFGAEKQQPPFTPSLMAQGTIRIPMGEQRLPSLKDLRYDVYVKALRVPLHLDDTMQGTVSAYLHLGNQLSGTHGPLMTGVLYAEKCRMAYTPGPAKPFTMPALPFNPELSLLVQIGAGNAFELHLSNLIYGTFPMTPTGPKLFPPEAVADPAVAVYGKDGKPVMDRHPVHLLTAESLQQIAKQSDGADGSYGTITGTLARPAIAVNFALVPRKSLVQLPGAMLSVQSAHGAFTYEIGSNIPPALVIAAEATGTVEQHKISVTISDTNNLLADQDFEELIMPVDTSQPPGEREFTKQEILSRFFGVADVISVIKGKERMFSTGMLQKYGSNIWLNRQLQGFASTVNLETLSLNFDPNWSPEVTLTTPEFGTSKWSTFRLGAMRNFTAGQSWRLWLDYRIPNHSWLQNLFVTGGINGGPISGTTAANGTTQGTTAASNGNLTFDLSLQYQFQFKTSGKQW